MSIRLHAFGLFIPRKVSLRYSLNRRMFGLQTRSGNFRKDRKLLSLSRTERQYLGCSDRTVVIVLTTLPLLPHILESLTNFKKYLDILLLNYTLIILGSSSGLNTPSTGTAVPWCSDEHPRELNSIT